MSDTHYRVGVDKDFVTTLTVGGVSNMTLTLPAYHVAQLIKLLAATIDTEYEVTVKELFNEATDS